MIVKILIFLCMLYGLFVIFFKCKKKGVKGLDLVIVIFFYWDYEVVLMVFVDVS